ncbi:MAG TPA: hypothetical protein VER03_20305 [Bryobacteraceae bacterium]|nr:hypothetical protein [Bryobacteraceae bacterium]
MFRTAFALSITMAMASSISAATMSYVAPILPVNGSGVTGMASFSLIDMTSLTVHILASGLEPNQIHPAHLHGKVGPGGILLPPAPPEDLDGDGYIETPEAELAVGPPIIPLGEFLVPVSGILDVQRVYDLTDPATFGGGPIPTGFQPFEFMTFELHGMTVPQGAGLGTPHEVNGTGGYKMMLPVGSGQPTPVPEAATSSLLAAGAALLAVQLHRARRSKS